MQSNSFFRGIISGSSMPHIKMMDNRTSRIRAILFDLHHTLTKTRVDFPELAREASKDVGIDLSHISNSQLAEATARMNIFMADYQIKNNVDIHWGTEPEQWIEPNREFFKSLGLEDYENCILVEFERAWKRATKSGWEMLTDEAYEVLSELNRRGYILGICTRRHDDPTELLRRWKIDNLFSVILWTAVPGYAKPSPFTLLQASNEIGINPRLCAYIGNMVDADIKAAQSAEMLPILVYWANPDELEKTTTDTITAFTLLELLDIFGNSPM